MIWSCYYYHCRLFVVVVVVVVPLRLTHFLNDLPPSEQPSLYYDLYWQALSGQRIGTL